MTAGQHTAGDFVAGAAGKGVVETPDVAGRQVVRAGLAERAQGLPVHAAGQAVHLALARRAAHQRPAGVIRLVDRVGAGQPVQVEEGRTEQGGSRVGRLAFRRGLNGTRCFA